RAALSRRPARRLDLGPGLWLRPGQRARLDADGRGARQHEPRRRLLLGWRRRRLGRRRWRRLFGRGRLIRRRRSVGRMVVAPISEEDRAAIAAAVAKAEAASDGEIVTIVAPRSDAYHDVALHYAVLLMLFVPAF